MRYRAGRSVGRSLHWHCRGREFESRPVHHYYILKSDSHYVRLSFENEMENKERCLTAGSQMCDGYAHSILRQMSIGQAVILAILSATLPGVSWRCWCAPQTRRSQDCGSRTFVTLLRQDAPQRSWASLPCIWLQPPGEHSQWHSRRPRCPGS